MDHRKARKIFWICWLLASVVMVLGAILPDEKMQKAVITIGMITLEYGNRIHSKRFIVIKFFKRILNKLFHCF